MSDLHIELEQAIRDYEMVGDNTRLNRFKRDHKELYSKAIHADIVANMDWDYRAEDKVHTTFGSLKLAQNQAFQEGIEFALHMLMHNETLVRIIGEYELSKVVAQLTSELEAETLYETPER